MILLRNCRLISELTEGYDQPVGDIVIDDEKILKIAEPGEIKEFDGEVIDVHGDTALPELFVIFLERVILSIVLGGIFATVLFHFL
ncbi:MAG: hypothetical protein HFE73_00490 [Firmicutes bacterium]|nr:hypothetical protein [Bacillota bacterium]